MTSLSNCVAEMPRKTTPKKEKVRLKTTTTTILIWKIVKAKKKEPGLAKKELFAPNVPKTKKSSAGVSVMKKTVQDKEKVTFDRFIIYYLSKKPGIKSFNLILAVRIKTWNELALNTFNSIVSSNEIKWASFDYISFNSLKENIWQKCSINFDMSWLSK